QAELAPQPVERVARHHAAPGTVLGEGDDAQQFLAQSRRAGRIDRADLIQRLARSVNPRLLVELPRLLDGPGGGLLAVLYLADWEDGRLGHHVVEADRGESRLQLVQPKRELLADLVAQPLERLSHRAGDAEHAADDDQVRRQLAAVGRGPADRHQAAAGQL